jgi:hypothetical protein
MGMPQVAFRRTGALQNLNVQDDDLGFSMFRPAQRRFQGI